MNFHTILVVAGLKVLLWAHFLVVSFLLVVLVLAPVQSLLSPLTVSASLTLSCSSPILTWSVSSPWHQQDPVTSRSLAVCHEEFVPSTAMKHLIRVKNIWTNVRTTFALTFTIDRMHPTWWAVNAWMCAYNGFFKDGLNCSRENKLFNWQCCIVDGVVTSRAFSSGRGWSCNKIWNDCGFVTYLSCVQ